MPAAFADAERHRSLGWLPKFLTDWRVGHFASPSGWSILLGLPAFYLATVVLNRAADARCRPARAAAGARGPTDRSRNAVPLPARLLMVSVAGRWLFSSLPLSLLVRQMLTTAAALIVDRRASRGSRHPAHSVVERVRRAPPVAGARRPDACRCCASGGGSSTCVIVLGGMLAVLRYFGVNPTPVLAGLGVGGIAVALAAQKTLENVIAGASLIVDQAVRVGDVLGSAQIEGTVDHIGLRSTRIRTLDRTIVSVPNSQIANMSLETLSARDKFWFHPDRRAALRDDRARRCASCSTASGSMLERHRRRSTPRQSASASSARRLLARRRSVRLRAGRGTGRTSWRSRRSCCSRSPTSSATPGPASRSRRRRCTSTSVNGHQRPQLPSAQLTPKLQLPETAQGLTS